MATLTMIEPTPPPDQEAVTLRMTREEARRVRAALWEAPQTEAGSRVFVVLRDADI